jgi:hypothetical protein
MSAGKEAGTPETFDWYVEPDQSLPAAAAGYSRARRDENRAASVGLAITWSLLFVLLAAAIVAGGHAAVGSLLRHAVAIRDAKGVGDVVYTMPDGVYCRHMSFDNATAEIREGAIERCPDRVGGGRPASASRFEWGGR